MITIQHTLCTMLATGCDQEYLDRYIAAILLPDAIRFYTKNRKLSHFEMKSDGTDCSYMTFPSDMKALSPVTIAQALGKNSHLVEEAACVIGEQTNENEFARHNLGLPPVMFRGILLHLWQDQIFDDFIRKMIDCDRRYEDVFVLRNGREVDGKEVRSVIATIEHEGFWVLADMLRQSSGIVFNQEWFDKNLYPVLVREYPEELAENTYKYMQIPAEIDAKITAGVSPRDEDLTCGITVAEFTALYESVVQKMLDDCEVAAYYGKNSGM